MIKEIITNPGVLGLIGVCVASGFVYLQHLNNRRDSYRKSNLSLDEKRDRALYWYQEHYHRARRLMIDLGHEEEVDKHLPFEIPSSALQGEK